MSAVDSHDPSGSHVLSATVFRSGVMVDMVLEHNWDAKRTHIDSSTLMRELYRRLMI